MALFLLYFQSRMFQKHNFLVRDIWNFHFCCLNTKRFTSGFIFLPSLCVVLSQKFWDLCCEEKSRVLFSDFIFSFSQFSFFHIRVHGVLEAFSPRKVDVPGSTPGSVIIISSFQDMLVVNRFLLQMKICKKNRENLDLDGRRNLNATRKVVFYIFDKIVL